MPAQRTSVSVRRRAAQPLSPVSSAQARAEVDMLTYGQLAVAAAYSAPIPADWRELPIGQVKALVATGIDRLGPAEILRIDATSRQLASLAMKCTDRAEAKRLWDARSRLWPSARRRDLAHAVALRLGEAREQRGGGIYRPRPAVRVAVAA
jgi:hypothetical protein